VNTLAWRMLIDDHRGYFSLIFSHPDWDDSQTGLRLVQYRHTKKNASYPGQIRMKKGCGGLYRIGLFSKINRITIKTLHHYDKTGLLKPAFVDRHTGYRYYSSEQIPVLQKIMVLRKMGFSIEEVMTLGNDQNIHSLFLRKKHDLEKTIDDAQQQLSQVNHAIDKLNLGLNEPYNVLVKELPPIIVFSKKIIIDDYSDYYELVPQINKEVRTANPHLQWAIPAYYFVMCLDSEFKEKNITIEYCEAVASYGTDTPTIKFKQIEVIPRAACIYHSGGYETIHKTYEYVYSWIDANGYDPYGDLRESYICGRWNTSHEKEWLTELQIPIKNRPGTAGF
jgi:DNA-binding transcriptional MerR regulator